ncbi:MAG: NAD(P)/FAD-dependent oxidoreductase [Xanthomonadales bacterium]|nr:NAD(P)/FAD-dependent oxidoreductase [Xanthomonadales bacterium]
MSRPPDIDVLIIGAGVVGLACGVAMARAGRGVIVAESEERAGEGVSSRNSGVIHAGLYYPTGSLKARVCVRGRELLYDFCARYGVPHQRTGKWVVAVEPAQLAELEKLVERAEANGLGRLRIVDRAELSRLEPALRAHAAIDVPQTGIVDVPLYVEALAGALQQAGGMLAVGNRVARITPDDGCFAVEVEGSEAVYARAVVNAAGLSAQSVARTVAGLSEQFIPPLHPASGHYYRSSRPVPFSRLVYPMPGVSGLGVHLGYDPEGRPRFGPDVRFPGRVDYGFDDSQKASFAESIRGWWPELDDDDLHPDFVGVRPKLVGPGEPTPDFIIQDDTTHGLRGLINLFGIESPGLTSSLAIGEEVRDRLHPCFD